MLSWIREWTGRRPVVVGSAALYLISQVTLVVMVQPLGPRQIYRVQATLSGTELLAIIAQWRDAGILDVFTRHLYPDFFHPVWYVTLLWCGITWALTVRGLSPAWNRLYLIPLAGGLLDLAENVLQLSILQGTGAGIGTLADIVVWLTFGKWLVLLFCINLPATIYFMAPRFMKRS